MSDAGTHQGPGPLLDLADPTLRALAATVELSDLLGRGAPVEDGTPGVSERLKPSQTPDGARDGFGTAAKAGVTVGRLSEADQLRGLELVAIASMALDALEM